MIRRLEIRRADAEIGQGRCHVGDRGQARRGAEREPYGCSGRDADEHRGRRPPTVVLPCSSAPMAPSASIRRPAAASGRVRCALTTEISAAAMASRIPGKCISVDNPLIAWPPGQSPVAMRAARSASRPASTIASSASATIAAGPRTGHHEQHDDPHDQQADQRGPDRLEPCGERPQEAQERALERARRLCGDDPRERQQRRHQADDVGRAPDARLIARCCVEPAIDPQEPARTDRPHLSRKRSHATPRV